MEWEWSGARKASWTFSNDHSIDIDVSTYSKMDMFQMDLFAASKDQ